MNSEFVLETQLLTKIFHGARGDVTALDEVSFAIPEGKTLALVGESGSGKTTAARLVLGLETQNSGTVSVLGKDLSSLNKKELRNLRRSIQVVQQNPYSQLNRRHSVQRIIETPLLAFNEGSTVQRKDKVVHLLESVGLDAAYLNRRPHELSGGQCQRVAIARALVIDPKIVVLDEAVSALDVSVRAQVLNLLRKLQIERNLTYLFITHDLGVAHYLADEIAVKFRGKIVEKGDRTQIFSNPHHHYTKNLISSVPLAEPPDDEIEMTSVDTFPMPNPTDACSYRNRCAVGLAKSECGSKELKISIAGSHEWLCHFPLESKV